LHNTKIGLVGHGSMKIVCHEIQPCDHVYAASTLFMIQGHKWFQQGFELGAILFMIWGKNCFLSVPL